MPMIKQRGPLLPRGMKSYPRLAGKLVLLCLCRFELPMVVTIVLGFTLKVPDRVSQLLRW